MKSIKALTKILSKEPPLPLGRWKIEKCESAFKCKVDWSNEDHCGPCGQYVLQIEKTEPKSSKPNKPQG